MNDNVTMLYRLAGTAILTFVLLLTSIRPAHAQLGDLGEIFEGGKDDATLLIREYLRPFGSGFGAGINSGWVDRANTHGVLGFHLKVNVAAALVPEADRNFDVLEIGLQELQLLGETSETPTFSGRSGGGGARLGIEREVNGETHTIADFRMPPGVGLNIVPTPMIQAGVGLPKNTEVMLRLIPPVGYQDYGEIYLYGLGFKHEVNQWLPGGRFWPVTISVMAGYTTFGSSSGLDARPSGSYEDPDNHGGAQSATWDGQEIKLTTDAFTMNVLVGKSLPIISVYGGLGFETSTTAVNVNGHYPYYTPNEDYTPGSGQSERVLNALVDPVDLSFSGANNLRALAGVRISLPLITFNVDYTLAEYQMVSAGFGISFR